MIVILTAVLSFSLETVEIFRQPIPRINLTMAEIVANSSNQLEYFERTEPKEPMKLVELSTGIFFLLELLIRVVVCPEKCKFFRSLMNWIDIICIVGMIAHYTVSIFKDLFPHLTHEFTLILRFLWLGRVLRVLRVFKLSKNHDGLRVLLLGVRASFKEITLVALVLLITILFYAPLIFLAEYHTPGFPNIPSGWWWALITMTTVGYGDVYPITGSGYLVGSFCAMSGLIILGLTVPIIANNFNLYYKYLQQRKLRQNKNKET